MNIVMPRQSDNQADYQQVDSWYIVLVCQTMMAGRWRQLGVQCVSFVSYTPAHKCSCLCEYTQKPEVSLEMFSCTISPCLIFKHLFCVCSTAPMRKAEQFLEVYSLDHVGSRYGTDGIKLSSKHLYLLNHCFESVSLSMNSESLKILRSFFSYMVHPPVLELHVHIFIWVLRIQTQNLMVTQKHSLTESLYSQGYPATPDLPASVSKVLGLWNGATIPTLQLFKTCRLGKQLCATALVLHSQSSVLFPTSTVCFKLNSLF